MKFPSLLNILCIGLQYKVVTNGYVDCITYKMMVTGHQTSTLHSNLMERLHTSVKRASVTVSVEVQMLCNATSTAVLPVTSNLLINGLID